MYADFSGCIKKEQAVDRYKKRRTLSTTVRVFERPARVYDVTGDLVLSDLYMRRATRPLVHGYMPHVRPSVCV